MKWTLENALPAAFVLAVAALCAAGFASYRQHPGVRRSGKSGCPQPGDLAGTGKHAARREGNGGAAADCSSLRKP